VVKGGKSFGSCDHWQPVAAIYWIAFQTDRIFVRRGRPTFDRAGMKGFISNHSASVQSLA
jgi:hypothetical protein